MKSFDNSEPPHSITVNPFLSFDTSFCSLILIGVSNFFIVKNTLIKESGLGVIFNSKLSKNFFDWKEHKFNLFLNNTGSQ